MTKAKMPKSPTTAKALLCILFGLAIVAPPVWMINLHYDRIGARDEIISNQIKAIENLKDATPDWESFIRYTDGMYSDDSYYHMAGVRERHRDGEARNLMFSMFWALIAAVAAGYYLGRMQSKSGGKD